MFGTRPDLNLSPAFGLLLACSDWPESHDRSARIAAAHQALNGDCTGFVELVDRHHMTPLAARALRYAGIDVPPEIHQRAIRQQRRALTMSGLSVRLVNDLAEHGIEAMLLKGSVLSQLLYCDPTIRYSVDIDLLVDWDQFEPAIACLTGHGLQLTSPSPPWQDWRIDLWRSLAKDVTLAHPGERIAIELHHRLKTPETLLPGLTLADARERVEIAGTGLAAFAREDLFVYLCAHGSTSLWDRLKWLADINALISREDLAGIERWQERSRELGTERCTALALLLVNELWDREIPASVHELARNDRAVQQLVMASRARLLGPVRPHSSFSNTFARRHLMRLRSDRAYRRSLRRELVQDRELLERYRLSEPLKWLYLPLRAVLFTQRKLGLR